MPNWCSNNVTINHDDPAKLAELVDAYKRGELLEHCLPTPKDENGELDKDWYNWRCNNWGTKWDVGGEYAFYDDTPEGLALSFSSAWSPPIAFYEFMKGQGFDIRASYFEPGIGFCGDWIDGMDNCYDGDWQDFPDHLVDEYNMEEWYEDDEEEVDIFAEEEEA